MSENSKFPDYNFKLQVSSSESEQSELSFGTLDPETAVNSFDESLYDNPSPNLFDSPLRADTESDVEIIENETDPEFEMVEPHGDIYGNLSENEETNEDENGDGPNSDSDESAAISDSHNWESESSSDEEYYRNNTHPTLIDLSWSERLKPQYHILDGEATYVMQTSRIARDKIYLKCSYASKKVGIINGMKFK